MQIYEISWIGITLLILGSLLMYLGGEITRALFMDFGKGSSGLTHSLYKSGKDSSNDDGDFLTIILVFFGTPYWIFVYVQSFREDEIEFNAIAYAAIPIVIEIIKINIAFTTFGWIGLAIIYGLFAIGFLRGHFANRESKISNN